ncbi:hypothetical protein QR685DRAFT_520430 [Neurospora intermedia]|uniref:Secreted peptide n=1 Tax=Neurospora intermedia TaxID=5142 RepID=A0ABR3DGT1_NEUIN
MRLLTRLPAMPTTYCALMSAAVVLIRHLINTRRTNSSRLLPLTLVGPFAPLYVCSVLCPLSLSTVVSVSLP